MAVNGNEEWRSVCGNPAYEISSLGRLRCGDRHIKGSVSKSTGYRRTAIAIDGKRREVSFHVMAAVAFIGPRPDDHEVNHIDHDKLNNRRENLEYLTKSDNQRYAWAMGRGPRGERHGRHTKPDQSARGERVNTAKLTDSDVRSIRAARCNGASYAQIGAQFNISTSQAFNIASGAQWKHVK